MHIQKSFHDSETLAAGQQVFSADAFIHKCFDNIEKVLLPKRATTKKFLPGLYELPGGHIDFGEDLKEGLKREIKEELEVDITIGDPFYVYTYINEIKKSHTIDVVYFARLLDDKQEIVIHPDDHSEYLWISEEEIFKVYTAGKDEDDCKIQAIRKGFALLRGEKHLLG